MTSEQRQRLADHMHNLQPIPSEPPQWFVDIYSEFQREQRASLVPNRLKGTTINQDGDAT